MRSAHRRTPYPYLCYCGLLFDKVFGFAYITMSRHCLLFYIAAFLLANHQQDMPRERIARHRIYLLNGRVPNIIRQWGFNPCSVEGKQIRQYIKDALLSIWNYTILQ